MSVKLNMDDREAAAVLAVHAHVRQICAGGTTQDKIDQLMLVMGVASAGLFIHGGKQAALDGLDLVRENTLNATMPGEDGPDPGFPRAPTH